MFEIILLLFVVVPLATMSLKTVRPTERAIVERFGKFNSYHEAGLLIVIPFVDNVVRVNITEQMVDATKQEVITKDALNATVDAQIYFKVMDGAEHVKRSQYSVNSYFHQIVQLARTTLRAIIGEMSLAEANSMRNRLNQMLAEELQKETEKWGIEVVRAELKEIEAPQDVQATMNEVVKAENTKIASRDYAEAAEIKADGERRAQIKIAEAHRQAQILQAEGESSAIEQIAKAKAKQIELVNKAAQEYFKGQAVELKKLETASEVLKNNTKYIVPEGSDLINVISESAGLSPLPISKSKKQ
jgi:regulator of protease activity HflC (stomatin/prohibitin superfamily)